MLAVQPPKLAQLVAITRSSFFPGVVIFPVGRAPPSRCWTSWRQLGPGEGLDILHCFSRCPDETPNLVPANPDKALLRLIEIPPFAALRHELPFPLGSSWSYGTAGYFSSFRVEAIYRYLRPFFRLVCGRPGLASRFEIRETKREETMDPYGPKQL